MNNILTLYLTISCIGTTLYCSESKTGQQQTPFNYNKYRKDPYDYGKYMTYITFETYMNQGRKIPKFDIKNAQCCSYLDFVEQANEHNKKIVLEKK